MAVQNFLGLAFINARFFFNVAGLTLERFLPLGKNSLKSPFKFSFVPFR